jgi:acetyl esterase
MKTSKPSTRKKLLISMLIIIATGLILYTAIRITPKGFASFGSGLLIKASAVLKRISGPVPYEIEARRTSSAANNALVDGPANPNDGITRIDLPIDLEGRSLSSRLYIAPTKMQALVLFLHGGGWALGTLDSYEKLCRSIAKNCHALVLSIDYRLAPEHPFPSAVQDSIDSYLWALNQIEVNTFPRLPVFVAGDSAGGNLAAVLCQQARDLKLPAPAGQILLYPALDLSNTSTDSYQRFATGYLLTKADMEWFRALYLPNPADYLDPRASPLLAADLTQLPPALILTAQLDILRDEGDAYAKALKAAGVHVQNHRIQGATHGFSMMSRFTTGARQTLKLMDSFIRQINQPPH